MVLVETYTFTIDLEDCIVLLEAVRSHPSSVIVLKTHDCPISNKLCLYTAGPSNLHDSSTVHSTMVDVAGLSNHELVVASRDQLSANQKLLLASRDQLSANQRAIRK